MVRLRLPRERCIMKTACVVGLAAMLVLAESGWGQGPGGGGPPPPGPWPQPDSARTSIAARPTTHAVFMMQRSLGRRNLTIYLLGMDSLEPCHACFFYPIRFPGGKVCVRA